MTDNENERIITITPNQESLSAASIFLDNCVEDFSIPMRTGYSVKVVADEIFSNIVYYSGATTAEIRFRNDPNWITLVFLDNGMPYNPLDAAEPDITIGAEERSIGGLGLFMVKKMAEHIQYKYIDNKNQLSVVISKTPKKLKISLEDLEA